MLGNTLLNPNRMQKNSVDGNNMVGIVGAALTSEELQDAQKGRTSHPPNPGAPRRTIPRTRPQWATRRGVRVGTLSLWATRERLWQTFSASC